MPPKGSCSHDQSAGPFKDIRKIERLTSQSIRIPRSKRCSTQASQEVEDRDARGQHKSSADTQNQESDPNRPGKHCVRVKVTRIAKDPDKDDFGGYMVVQGSSTATRLVVCSSGKLKCHSH